MIKRYDNPYRGSLWSLELGDVIVAVFVTRAEAALFQYLMYKGL